MDCISPGKLFLLKVNEILTRPLDYGIPHTNLALDDKKIEQIKTIKHKQYALIVGVCTKNKPLGIILLLPDGTWRYNQP